jgi:uncharacterized protein YPO0396
MSDDFDPKRLHLEAKVSRRELNEAIAELAGGIDELLGKVLQEALTKLATGIDENFSTIKERIEAIEERLVALERSR